MRFAAFSSGFALTLAFAPSLALPAASPDAGKWKAPGEGDGALFTNLEILQSSNARATRPRSLSYAQHSGQPRLSTSDW